MAKTIDLTSKTARARLKPQHNPYWEVLNPGKLALGYRPRGAGLAGLWLMRTYIGINDKGIGHYNKKNIGVADDLADADGQEVLSFVQARQKALDGYGQREKQKKAWNAGSLAHGSCRNRLLSRASEGRGPID